MTENLHSSKHTYIIALSLFLLTLVILLWTQSDYGLAWDEPFNYYPATFAWSWTQLVFTNPASALSDEQIIKSWSEIHEHPSVSKWIACFSHGLFHAALGDLLSFRLGEIVFFALFLAIFYLILSELFSKTVGLFSALALFLMPRIFAQAHFATTDIPMMIMGFYTVICFYKGLDSQKWSVLLGIVWGLALATKINALFLPIPLIVWAHIYHRQKWGRNIFCMFFISPIIFVLSWPWLWRHTLDRIFEYLEFYVIHKTGTVFYLGKMYYNVSVPWHYTWVYLFTTIPIVTLFLILFGIFQIVRQNGLAIFVKSNDQPSRQNLRSVGILFLFLAGFPILLQSLPNIPRYDGIRLFLNAFPFLAALAGIGLVGFLRSFVHSGFWGEKSCWHYLIIFGFLLSPLYDIADTHPYQLSYYNYLIGGINGAHKQGLESTYWCEAVNKNVLDYINRNAPPNSKILFMSFDEEVLYWYKEHGYLRPDIDYLHKDTPDYAVLLCRQGFFGNKEWYYYNRIKPLKSFHLQGVPLVNIYPGSLAIP